MDKELKEYLDRLEKNMVTKSDIIDMATKNDINKLDKKIDKVNRGLLGYLEHIDTNLQEHIRDSEVHKKVSF